MKYTINEIAKLLGVTTHKLRHYEKMKIIAPSISETNGYRYYCVLDSRRFSLARYYKAAGCSLEEIYQLFNLKNEVEIIESFEDKINELKKELIIKELNINAMEKYLKLIATIHEIKDEVIEYEINDFIRLEFSSNEIIDKEFNNELKDILLQYPSLITWVSRIPKDSFNADKQLVDYKFGINMDIEYAKRLNINIEKYDYYKGGKYLLCLMIKNNRDDFTRDTLIKLNKYVKDNNINHFDCFSSCIQSITVGENEYNNYHYLALKI